MGRVSTKRKQYSSRHVSTVAPLMQDHAAKLLEQLQRAARIGDQQLVLLAVECDTLSYFTVDLAIGMSDTHAGLRRALRGLAPKQIEERYAGQVISANGLHAELQKRLDEYGAITRKSPAPQDALPQCAKSMCDWYASGSMGYVVEGEVPRHRDDVHVFMDRAAFSLHARRHTENAKERRFALTATAVAFAKATTVPLCLGIAAVLGRHETIAGLDSRELTKQIQKEVAAR